MRQSPLVDVHPNRPPKPTDLDAFNAFIDARARSAEQMRAAAKKFEFEKAAQLRDRLRTLKQKDLAGLFSREAAASQAPADAAS